MIGLLEPLGPGLRDSTSLPRLLMVQGQRGPSKKPTFCGSQASAYLFLFRLLVGLVVRFA